MEISSMIADRLSQQREYFRQNNTAGNSSSISWWNAARLRELQRQAGGGAEIFAQLARVIDTLGEASREAQGLNHALTSTQRLIECPDHRLYVLQQKQQYSGDGRNSNNNSPQQRNNKIIGILKVGVKKLFIRSYTGALREINPLCALDFYVVDREQRHGYGRELFEAMLAAENTSPHALGIDRPSPKFIAFLRKHYGLTEYVKQNNNFVVFEKFFTHKDHTWNNSQQSQHQHYTQQQQHPLSQSQNQQQQQHGGVGVAAASSERKGLLPPAAAAAATLSSSSSSSSLSASQSQTVSATASQHGSPELQNQFSGGHDRFSRRNSNIANNNYVTKLRPDGQQATNPQQQHQHIHRARSPGLRHLGSSSSSFSGSHQNNNTMLGNNSSSSIIINNNNNNTNYLYASRHNNHRPPRGGSHNQSNNNVTSMGYPSTATASSSSLTSTRSTTMNDNNLKQLHPASAAASSNQRQHHHQLLNPQNNNQRRTPSNHQYQYNGGNYGRRSISNGLCATPSRRSYHNHSQGYDILAPNMSNVS